MDPNYPVLLVASLEGSPVLMMDEVNERGGQQVEESSPSLLGVGVWEL